MAYSNGSNGGNGSGNGGNGGRSRLTPTRAKQRRRARRQRGRAGRRALLIVGLLLVLGIAGGVSAAAFTGVEAVRNNCTLESLQEVRIGQNSFVYAANGQFLGTIPAENNRQPLEYEEISPWLIKASVAIEDQRFWKHKGLDYESIARAAFANYEAQDVVQGGSTITQQLVRNLYRPVGNEQTLERKVKEACLALKLEKVGRRRRFSRRT